MPHYLAFLGLRSAQKVRGRDWKQTGGNCTGMSAATAAARKRAAYTALNHVAGDGEGSLTQRLGVSCRPLSLSLLDHLSYRISEAAGMSLDLAMTRWGPEANWNAMRDPWLSRACVGWAPSSGWQIAGPGRVGGKREARVGVGVKGLESHDGCGGSRWASKVGKVRRER